MNAIAILLLGAMGYPLALMLWARLLNRFADSERRRRVRRIWSRG
jgi:hypothetical protein